MPAHVVLKKLLITLNWLLEEHFHGTKLMLTPLHVQEDLLNLSTESTTSSSGAFIGSVLFHTLKNLNMQNDDEECWSLKGCRFPGKMETHYIFYCY